MRIFVVVGFALCLQACESLPSPEESTGKAVEIGSVWLLEIQPCNGNYANAMRRDVREAEVKNSKTVILKDQGISFRIPPISQAKEVVVKLFLNDRSRGVVDHYILLAEQDLAPPLGAVLITELPKSMTINAAFRSVDVLQKKLAGSLYSTVKRREYESKFGRTVELIVPTRIGSHCFPTSDYKFSSDSRETIGISRFIMKSNVLVEATLIVSLPKNSSGKEDYARKAMDEYWAGLSI